MALLWMDSFDHYLTADLPEKYTDQHRRRASTPPRGGAPAARCVLAATPTGS